MKKLISLVIAIAFAMNMGAIALADDAANTAQNAQTQVQNTTNQAPNTAKKTCNLCRDQVKAVVEAQKELMKLIFSADATKDQIADAAEKFINSRIALKTCANDNGVSKKCTAVLRGKKFGWMKLFGGPKAFWFGK